ncbi:MAG: hypothetical protein ABL953_03565 [Ilumatobacteraceae bacterium]
MTATPAPKAAKPAAKAVKSTAKAAAKPAAKAAAKPTTRRASSARAAGKRGAKPQAVLPENHTPSEAVAFDIRQDRIDLSPSVARIQNAGLNEPGTMHAISLFRDSLTTPGDPNRDPAVAIEAGRSVDSRS